MSGLVRRGGKVCGNFSDVWKLSVVALFLVAGCRFVPEAREGERAIAPLPPRFGEVGMQDGFLTVDGERFLVVGVGYEPGCRKGQLPWERKFEPDVLGADFARIRKAGFNTIRTWAPLLDEELELAAEYGLWAIPGIWFDPAGDFADPKFQDEQLRLIEREVGRMSKHPNVLCYLLLNEPHGHAVHSAGVSTVKAFYAKLREAARRADPKRLFSYSNCVATDFVMPDEWDFVAANVYPYSPVTIEKALGYRTYLEILRDRYAGGKPMLITEFGLSVSPRGDGRGYGGNSLEEQRDGVLRMWNDILNTGCGGGCVFMWTDGWWKYGDKDRHDDHAEEWYGLIETDSERIGRPRPLYYALQDYNRAIRTQPRDGDAVAGDSVAVEVWAPEAAQVQARIGDGGWEALKRVGRQWWRGEIPLKDVKPGAEYLWTRAVAPSGEASGLKSCIVRVGGEPSSSLSVKIRPVSSPFDVGVPMPLEVEVRDGAGRPVSGRMVNVGRYLHTQWNEAAAEAETDGEGIARVELPALPAPGIASIAAGAAYEDGLIRRRAGDYVHVDVE
ncbi:MAG: Glycosyl hydrolases family 2, TIM barrel domain [Verrucomicrobia bacterium ADurb.Bin345]|nr:MAG: Glycosyl hydrolases family 2, TIM barrel domain [Verrucomicrobia bacterium ADurb.Bin345]